MPLNKLDNFIKNTEGRILYVNPSDLDSTDSITNEGNSLAQPFKTVQRALIEAARFSFLKGSNNDITEKTTILLFPGEHIIDNRPGFAIYNNTTGGQNVAYAVPPSGGTGSPASTALSLEIDSNFDLTQEDNILYKFNSVHGGVVVPRGTSIVGLDLRKTKLRPKYVPNPTYTYEDAPRSSIFKITGACYFWQFSIFDGALDGEVYTDPKDFTEANKSTPAFSHHKLTCFEYCDGVNVVNRDVYGNLTDLDMYYSKVGNAYNTIRKIENEDKFPQSSESFAKRAPEWEIVGAFASDPIGIADVTSDYDSRSTASDIVHVTTLVPHGLNAGTPIRIKGVGRTPGTNQLDPNSNTYNVSTVVKDVISDKIFTYQLEKVPVNLSVTPTLFNATVTVEVDTVGGASPYIFNISLRSVWGMNGMHADGSKASGFRSMVVAQFTAVSLQKDDRAFAKYNKRSRVYNFLSYGAVNGGDLPAGASSATTEGVYHLDQDAVYRPGWESSHIKVSNDSFIQVVSVFAIGFTYHFDMNSGADASITNSNSNFGQVALKSDGFKPESFNKDDHGYITGIIGPRAIDQSIEDRIEWLALDVEATRVNNALLPEAERGRLYLYGFNSESATPVSLTQGYRVGAKENDVLYLEGPDGVEYSAPIYMMGNGDYSTNNQNRNEKSYTVTEIKNDNQFFIGNNNLSTGERVIINSKSGDLPEGLVEHQVYFAITHSTDPQSGSNTDGLSNNQYIKLAASYTYAFLGEAVDSFKGNPNSDLIIKSRVSDKNADDIGSPLVWDSARSQWYINLGYNNDIYQTFLDRVEDADGNRVGLPIGWNDPNSDQVTDDTKYSESTDLAYIKRIADERALDEKVYKVRVVIPKEVDNAKNPEIGFVLQESKSTAPLFDNDIPYRVGSRTSLPLKDDPATDNFPLKYNRNSRFIKDAEKVGTVFKYTSEQPHNLKVNDVVIIKNVKDDTVATTGQFNRGYNGSFIVQSIVDEYTFNVSTKDIIGLTHNAGVISSFDRTAEELPVYQRNDIRSNLYIYRNDVISDYVKDEKDGIYHLYILNASNALPGLFDETIFTQTPVDLYPQLDRDNLDSNPNSAKTFAKRSPIGDVVTNDLKKSITRETVDILCKDLNLGLDIQSITNPASTSPTLNFQYRHGLGGALGGTLTNTTTNHTTGTYYNVKLYSDLDLSESSWKGATGRVTVGASGNVTEILIQNGGSGYVNGDSLYPDTDVIGGTSSENTKLTLTTNGIVNYIGDVLQLTGDPELPDSYHRITSVGDKTITFARTVGDPSLTENTKRFAFITGPSVQISATSYGVIDTVNTDGETTITVGVITLTTTESHGLNVGNKFRVINSSNANLGDFVVHDVVSPTVVNVRTKENLSGSAVNGYILRHGLSSNQGISDIRTESYGSRGISFYDGSYFKLTSNYSAGSSASLNVECLNGTFIDKRIQLGDFLQINDEIFRVSGTVDSPGNNASGTIIVNRGYLGTRQGNHITGDIVKKIKAPAIEFRRPTICRASAHTFEYLGYGPGNYSTALPQVQIKTLSEREDFLVQAQERSAGAVVYTGMNNSGDTFNGNTKVSAASGETISYDIPKPTITGQDPSKLSVAFDEVTVRERIIVEGGVSGFVLSQFDGPVTMTRQLRVKGKTTLDGQLRVTFNKDAVNANTGSAVIKGGVGVGGNSWFQGTTKLVGQVRIDTGAVPQKDQTSYLGTNALAFDQAHIGDVQIGAAASTTISTRKRGLLIEASGPDADGDLTLTSKNNNVDINAKKSFDLDATTGGFDLTVAENIDINAGTGKSFNVNETTYIEGDLEVKGQGTNVPPGDRSGTIRANYLEVPNVTPVGSIVLWAGDKNDLPTGTVNGSVVTNWAVCDGQTLSRSTYSTLYNLIGTRYGNTSSSNFKVPDLRNRFPIGSNSDTGTDIETDDQNNGQVKRKGGSKDAILKAHAHPSTNTDTHSHDEVTTNQSGQLSMTGSAEATPAHTHPHDIALSQENQGEHAHQYSISSAKSNGAHMHKKHPGAGGDQTEGFSVNSATPTTTNGAHGHAIGGGVQQGGGHGHPTSSTGADHAHDFSIQADGAHGHTVQQSGEEARNKNLPPYFALWYIIRII
jgi:microcystin-dependent protein